MLLVLSRYINKIFYNLQGTLQGGNSTDFGHTTIANLDPKVKSNFLGKNIFFLSRVL